MNTSPNLSTLCTEVCAIARKGGQFLRNECTHFKRDAIEEKSTHNYVSYVDKQSERNLVNQLHALLPEAGFITEEETSNDPDKEFVWIIDPLDGTTNFIHNLAPYCISIALRQKEEVVLGVVYEVCRNECFYAWKGGGAYLNGTPIQVSEVNRLDQALLLMGFPYKDSAFKPLAIYMVQQFYGHLGGLRLLGSAAAELCYIACGRAEMRIEAYLGCWDVAAGALILLEAGGKVSDFRGGNHYWNGSQLLATNHHLHAPILEIIKQGPPIELKQ